MRYDGVHGIYKCRLKLLLLWRFEFGHSNWEGPTVCATPISAMGSVMGQFPLRNGVLLMSDIGKPRWPMGKILVMAMGFVDHLGQCPFLWGLRCEIFGLWLLSFCQNERS